MTDQQSPFIQSAEARLTGVESGLRHFHEISAMRNQQIWETLSQIKAHNDRQDNDLEVMQERLQHKIAEIYLLLWSGMRWAAGLLALTVLTIVLTSLKLI